MADNKVANLEVVKTSAPLKNTATYSYFCTFPPSFALEELDILRV